MVKTMTQKIDSNYIKVKTNVYFQRAKKFFSSFIINLVGVLLISLAIMLAFDFVLHTGIGLLQLIESMALYFIVSELEPRINKLVIFK